MKLEEIIRKRSNKRIMSKINILLKKIDNNEEVSL